jgi:hypothetical protein
LKKSGAVSLLERTLRRAPQTSSTNALPLRRSTQRSFSLSARQQRKIRGMHLPSDRTAHLPGMQNNSPSLDFSLRANGERGEEAQRVWGAPIHWSRRATPGLPQGDEEVSTCGTSISVAQGVLGLTTCASVEGRREEVHQRCSSSRGKGASSQASV